MKKDFEAAVKAFGIDGVRANLKASLEAAHEKAKMEELHPHNMLYFGGAIDLDRATAANNWLNENYP